LPSFGDGLGSDCISGDCLDDCIVSSPSDVDLSEYYRATQPEKKSLFSCLTPKKKITPQAIATGVSHAANAACNCEYDAPSAPYGAQYDDAPEQPHTFPPVSLTPVSPIPTEPISEPRIIQTAYRIPNKNTPTPNVQ
ncbi:MAG: hypothetical protein ACRC46_13030, partial [Thermoguttaceae bacterium]